MCWHNWEYYTVRTAKVQYRICTKCGRAEGKRRDERLWKYRDDLCKHNFWIREK